MIRIAAFERPVVAAVTGHALALGAICLFTTDLRIGTSKPKAKIGMNEVHIGMPLPRFAIEFGRARLSNRHFTQVCSAHS